MSCGFCLKKPVACGQALTYYMCIICERVYQHADGCVPMRCYKCRKEGICSYCNNGERKPIRSTSEKYLKQEIPELSDKEAKEFTELCKGHEKLLHAIGKL